MGGFLWTCFFMLLIIIVPIFLIWFDGIGKLHRYWFERKSLAEKAEMFMKQDFSPKCARASFYIGNNYRHKMSQADWQKYCQERVGNILDKNSQEYADAVAPILNAIVLDEEGLSYIRRGMENMTALDRFLPGVNDRISLNYFVEPYEYVENKELLAKTLAKEALRQKEFNERYERDRPIREAREAERKAAEQQRYQEQKARREEDAARRERQRQEARAASDARARCSQCVNGAKCSINTKSIPGACGGYRPR